MYSYVNINICRSEDSGFLAGFLHSHMFMYLYDHMFIYNPRGFLAC